MLISLTVGPCSSRVFRELKMSIHLSTYTIQRFKQVQSLLDQLDPHSAPQALLVPGSPEPSGTIIVFPGSFNPPTLAHLALMKQARQHLRLQAFSEEKESQAIHLYAAISKHIVDKENVERPLL